MPGRKITEADRKAAKNLKRIWQERKQEDSTLTQQNIASTLGWETQAIVSQYMNAMIALNTDATLKFAKFFNVKPSEIREDIHEIAEEVGNYKTSSKMKKFSVGKTTKQQVVDRDLHAEVIRTVNQALNDMKTPKSHPIQKDPLYSELIAGTYELAIEEEGAINTNQLKDKIRLLKAS